MAHSHIPVESFGPEILDALLAGSLSRIELSLPYASAVKFRQRVYQLRNAMRRENHTEAAKTSRTRIQIIWPDGTPVKTSTKNVSWPLDPKTPCKLVISPYDSEFADALKEAGVKSKEVDDDILAQALQNPALKGYE